MTDFDNSEGTFIEKGVLLTSGCESPFGQLLMTTNAGNSSAVWPSANRAFFCPVKVAEPCTVYKMSFTTGVQSGNYDIGIYDVNMVRLVSTGSTSVPVAGPAIADITDTALTPGIYFLALCLDNTTVTVQRASTAAEINRSCGIQAQSLGSVTLPNPATFANPADAFVPLISAHLSATV